MLRRILTVVIVVLVVCAAFVLTVPRFASAQDNPDCKGDMEVFFTVANDMRFSSNMDKDIITLKQLDELLTKLKQECPGLTDTVSQNPTATPLLNLMTDTPSATFSAADSAKATRTAIADNRTATADAKKATATFLADYKVIDVRELDSYADNHVGEKVIVKGTVFNVDSDVIQISNGSVNIYVQLADTASGVYKGDYVIVYGVVYGSYSFENQAGNTISQPRLNDAFIKK